MDFHNISECGMDYIKLITRNTYINREELRYMKQLCYAVIKKEFFSLKYEHVILEDKMCEIALLIACTKIVKNQDVKTQPAPGVLQQPNHTPKSLPQYEKRQGPPYNPPGCPT